MSTIDDDFRDLALESGLGVTAAEQLRHAARALARMEPWMATSIMCTRHIPAHEILAFSGLAYRLAAEHGLGVRVEPGTPMCVRFFRRQVLVGDEDADQRHFGASAGRLAARLTSLLRLGRGRRAPGE